MLAMTIAPFDHMGPPKTSDVFLYLFMDGPMVMQMVRAIDVVHDGPEQRLFLERLRILAIFLRSCSEANAGCLGMGYSRKRTNVKLSQMKRAWWK